MKLPSNTITTCRIGTKGRLYWKSELDGIPPKVKTHFSVFELLFDVVDNPSANFADEATEEQLRSNFAGACYSSTDAHQGSDLVRSQITNTGY